MADNRDAKPNHTAYGDISPYVTKDGSEIRELMHPLLHGNYNQSLAEARIEPGGKTLLHRHRESEELYHVLSGEGTMTLGAREIAIKPGDTIAIPPLTTHGLHNTGQVPLVILCCCSPPYSHDDTEVL